MFINSHLSRNISKDFTTTEISNASHSVVGGFLFDERLVFIAQYVRDALNTPVEFTSAVRSAEFQNKLFKQGLTSVDGYKKTSFHQKGQAGDVKGKGVVSFLETAYKTKNHHWDNMVNLGLKGLGIYDTFVHIDTREGDFAYWNKKKPISYLIILLMVLGAIILKYKFL